MSIAMIGAKHNLPRDVTKLIIAQLKRMEELRKEEYKTTCKTVKDICRQHVGHAHSIDNALYALERYVAPIDRFVEPVLMSTSEEHVDMLFDTAPSHSVHMLIRSVMDYEKIYIEAPAYSVDSDDYDEYDAYDEVYNADHYYDRVVNDNDY